MYKYCSIISTIDFNVHSTIATVIQYSNVDILLMLVLLLNYVLSPLQLLQEMESEPDLLENSRDVCSVLELIGKKLMNVDNDGFCLKVHYLGFLLQQSRESGVKNVMKRCVCVCVRT